MALDAEEQPRSRHRAAVRHASWRARAVVVVLVGACVGLVTVAVTGAAKNIPGMDDFLPLGHWFHNTPLGSIVHVDGGAQRVDANAKAPDAEPGSLVVQGDDDVYVVGRKRIDRLGKSTLQVQRTHKPPAREVPDTLETAGGPYLIYRAAGTIVRLGDRLQTIALQDRLGPAVATRDGTVWVHRLSDGAVCRLDRGVVRLSCPGSVPKGHRGALTTVADRPMLLDTTADALHEIGPDGLGPARQVGVDLPEGARPSATDTAGRVAVLDPAKHRLHLLDAGAGERPAARPVSVDLPAGEYLAPAATGGVVALVDRSTGALRTYTADGKPSGQTSLPGDQADSRVTRGEDGRLYVDTPTGDSVTVVSGDGQVSVVPVGGKPVDPSAPPRVPAPGPVPAPGAPVPSQQPPQRPPVPAGPPGAPGSVRAAPGDGSATVSWAPASASGAPVSGYRVSWSGPTSGSTSVAGDARSARITGLRNGGQYTVTVRAESSAGPGPGASAEVSPVGVAGAPRDLTAKAGDRTVTLSWAEPDLSGGELLHYVVTATGQAERRVKGTSATFTGLDNGTGYRFTVRAVTRHGAGTSTGAAATASATPAAPPEVTITDAQETGPNQITVWVDVDDNGGGPVTCRVFLQALLGTGSKTHDAPCSGRQAIVVDDVDTTTQWQVTVQGTNRAGTGETSNSAVVY